MYKNYIEFENGEILRENDFNKLYPMTMIRNNILRIEICQFIATEYYKLVPSSLEWKLLVNMLSSRSNKVNIITMIVLISKTRKIKVINIDFMDKKFNFLFDYDIKFIKNDFNFLYIDKSQFNNAIIKCFINKFFRILKNKRIKNNSSVIRTWTELDAELHKKVFLTSTIFIYPFGINIKRGIIFIKKTFKENSNVTLMGVPYSFNKLINIFISRNKNKDLLLLEYEIDAMKKHRKDFIDFKTIYTSDEYIPAIPFLYNELLREGKSIINIAHGIGIYNPYNLYTKFELINNLQKSFYKNFDQKIEYTIPKKYFITQKVTNEKLETVFVFIHQANLSKFNLLYEEKLQKKILSKLNSFKLSNIYVKLHPNCGKREKKQISIDYKNIIQLNEFNLTKNYLFLTMYSSAYYDFKKFGKFIFIEDDFFSSKNLFENIHTIHINELEKIFKSSN